jgi:hypothetical protein
MPQYMLLIYGDPSLAPAQDSPEGQAEFGRWMGYTQAMRDAGVFVAGDALHPAETASTVRVPNGERVVTDGPFAETKEILGGYYVLDLPDLDAALTWAEQAPNAAYGSVEVRPVVDFG